MNKLMGLIVFLKNDCFRAKSSKEFVIMDNFEEKSLRNMVQDGVMIVKNNVNPATIPKGLDYFQINGLTFFRNNSVRQLDWLRENGTHAFTESRDPLYRRIDFMVDHPRIIYSLLRYNNATDKKENYIEYGVRSGACIEQIAPHVDNAYGVDISPYDPKSKNVKFHCMTTDEFSEKHLPNITFNYAFIDADHASKQTLIDFEYIYKHIKQGGYIFLHDTYPYSQEFLRPDFCNDCYKTPLEIRKRYPSIEMLTFALNPGLTVIHKV